MSIITGRGDSGETDLLFGKRLPKTSLRIEALGAVDELNAALGLARAACGDPETVSLIDSVQERLVGLMGQIACLPEDRQRYQEKNYATIGAAEVAWIETTAKAIEAKGVRFHDWARPGAEGSLARAGLDFARAVARRAERLIWALRESGDPLDHSILLFLNRLSDFLWILARVETD